MFSSSRMTVTKHLLKGLRAEKLFALFLSTLLLLGALFPAGVQALARGPNFTYCSIFTPGFIWQRADSANRGLIKNGYQGLAYIGPPFDPNSQFTRATVFHYLQDPYSLGLYLNAHGKYGTKISDGYGEWMTYRDIAAHNVKPWRFVFLDACETGKKPYFAHVFGIPDGTPQRAFLGWKIIIGQIASYYYSTNFFHYWGPGVRIDAASYQAKVTAIDQSWSEGLCYTPERFDIALYGDGGYDGGAPF